MKTILLAIVLLGAMQTPPSFAKELRARRADGPAVAASPKVDAGKAAKSHIRTVRQSDAGVKGVHASTGERATANGANPVDPHQSDAIETPAAVMTPRPGVTPDKGRDVNARFKITAPGNFQARRVPVLRSSNPVARNAIGQPVVRHEDTAGSGGARVGTVVSAPLPSSSAPLSRTESLAKPSGSFGGPSVGLQHPGPAASTSISSRGRVGGTSLIRPALAPSAIGAAKTVAGISGTTLRPKR